MKKEKKEPIRILNVVPNMRAAGIESFIMNVYRNIDRDKVQFDFLVHNQRREFFDDEIEKLGGRIYRLTLKDDKNFIKYIKDLNEFFKTHKEYKIVHGHMQSMMPLYLKIAKKQNVPVRIAHSHNSNYEKSIKGLLLHVFSRFSKYYSTFNCACSNNSGKYLFNNRDFKVIYNGVDIDKYSYNTEKRKKIRKVLGIEDKFVIGNIGRFELQKNHDFLIDIFKKYHEKNEKAVLLLIGEGKLQSTIEKKVDDYKLNDCVKFLGVRKDADYLYNGMDCFVLPSLYEGLPVVGVEAQVSGLPTLFSDNITKEVGFGNKTFYLPINSIDKWVEKLETINESKQKRNSNGSDNFDIKSIAKQMKDIYEVLYED